MTFKSFPKQKRIEDPKYLAWIRNEPCLVCGWGKIDAHHPKHTKFGGNLGWNVKADDRKALPLCRGDHRECENGEERFYSKYNIAPKAEAKRLNKKYEVENEDKNKIHS